MLITIHLLPYRLNSLPTLSAVSWELPVSDAYKTTTLSMTMTSSGCWWIDLVDEVEDELDMGS
jgi:hypothetical protein